MTAGASQGQAVGALNADEGATAAGGNIEPPKGDGDDGDKKKKGGKERSQSARQAQKDVEAGRAPDSIDRVDKGRAFMEHGSMEKEY
jgi:hypothetical protein